VLELHPSLEAAGADSLERLRAELEKLPDVDQVQLDRDWAVRFAAILALVEELGRVLAVLLAVGVVAVIGNTVRLEIQARGAEIEVTKLVGGSNAFVRRPFLYTGVLYGGIAALLAWSMVALAGIALAPPAARLAASYGSAFLLQGPGLQALGAVVGAGAILGWLGAGLAAWRQLAQLEPSA
jgi:cell division transport system permease protein